MEIPVAVVVVIHECTLQRGSFQAAGEHHGGSLISCLYVDTTNESTDVTY